MPYYKLINITFLNPCAEALHEIDFIIVLSPFKYGFDAKLYMYENHILLTLEDCGEHCRSWEFPHSGLGSCTRVLNLFSRCCRAMSLGTDQSLAKPGTGRHPASSRATSIHAISFLFWHVYLIVHSPIINSYLLAILQIPYYTALPVNSHSLLID